MSNQNNYKPTIGIECHVQLKTRTKLFAPVDNDSREASPNQHISHICLGMPGALPVLNQSAIDLAARAAFALGTKPQKYSAFDRKHYFYPDLPKGYQITQQAHPIIKDGAIIITVEGEEKRIRIERAHLEEDAGKSTHPQVGDYSLVDLNRAGTPLLEIVSAPDLHSAKEAREYARELYLRMRYAGVSEADLYHGNMRFDVNVSVSKDDTLGTRTETKNLNSFRSVERAVEYETKRQTELLEKGQVIVQETRGWDDAKQRTTSQRSKEEAHDYRYFPEPDIPPVELSDAYIAEAEKNVPIMPDVIRQQLKNRNLQDEQIDILVAFEIEDKNPYVDILLDETIDDKAVQSIAKLMIQVEIPRRSDDEKTKIAELFSLDYRRQLYLEVVKLQLDGQLSSTNAKGLLIDLLFSGAKPKNIRAYADQQGYIQVSDTGQLAEIIDQVIQENPKASNDVSAGEMKAVGFLVGCVMKASHGKANPGLVKEMLVKKLQQ